MRAVVLHEHGGPEVLTIENVDEPTPGPDQILVDVAYTALNRADTLQRMGGYADPRNPAVEIPGLEYAGTVAAIGADVTEWKIGDRVMGIESGGCYAEKVVTHARQALPIPSNIDTADAAAIPEVFLTAWDALVVQGGLTSGRWALVHAGASGVGTAGIQIAKAIGARIAVTCSAGKADACRELGADLVLERSPADWLGALKAEVPQGVDVILDVVGGDEADRNFRAVAMDGSIIQVGLMGGGSAPVNMGLLLMKRITWTGTTLRARPLERKLSLCQRFISEIIPLVESGALVPVIDSRYALDDIADAHRHMEANRNVGKILVSVA
ncbi:NAD(P)H-quinone oxidoreductase [Ilumatobacter coccineus]|uniref:Putative quinone oxidoreductase n=1 Tax=Ilumatobacter coccineus (strain NBRC 103263 / KCTC 29153 / YM16-304) TaxID=1313172 RepID=A0A6C7ECR8_ILUCY|nr:NAD(P)H-quinone oxidoreductase [Ilumatobacter coccineus]BAN04170.1 putative quinone oxidoreductase [Ilumatobacter coccineus YM16-304]